MALVIERVPFGADLDWSWAWRPKVAGSYEPKEPRTQEYPSGLLAGCNSCGGTKMYGYTGYGEDPVTPPPEEKGWFEKNWYYVVGGVAALGLGYWYYKNQQEESMDGMGCMCGSSGLSNLSDFGRRRRRSRRWR